MATETDTAAEKVTTIKRLVGRTQEVNVQLDKARAHLQVVAERLDGSQPPSSTEVGEKVAYPGELGELEHNIGVNELLADQINEIVGLLERL